MKERASPQHGTRKDGGTPLCVTVSSAYGRRNVIAAVTLLFLCVAGSPPGALHVRVNIPAFTVRVAEENRFVMQMRAIVGSPRTPTPAFSVGVEKPARLAEVLLAGGEWPGERIQAAMADGRRRVVPLPAPIPVHLLYLTAWVAPNDVVHFRDDVYGRDRTAGGPPPCRSSNPQLADR